MNKLFKTLSFLAVLTLLLAAWSIQSAASQSALPPPSQNQPEAQAASVLIPEVVVTYDTLIDKPLTDQTVASFLARNNCADVESLQICRSAGMALWTDADQTVQSIVLYPGNRDGFAAYQGSLPFGLAFTDTMEMVEQKLGHPVEIHAPHAGWVPRLPEEGVTVDHVHYQAMYKEFGLTVMYNSPSASDKGATINSILINQ